MDPLLHKDLVEIKTDVKEMRGMLQKALVDQAIIEQRLNTIAGRVNSIVAIALAIVSGLTVAAWDFMKHKLGIS